MLHKCKERAQLRMYGLQDVLLRTSIVLGMVAAVVTILYFTPTPGKVTLIIICILSRYMHMPCALE